MGLLQGRVPIIFRNLPHVTEVQYPTSASRFSREFIYRLVQKICQRSNPAALSPSIAGGKGHSNQDKRSYDPAL